MATKQKTKNTNQPLAPIPSQTLYHYHNGIDQPRLDPRNFLGFPIFRAVPTHTAEEGTQVYVIIPGAPDTYFLYVMLDRVWRGVNLPL